MTSHLITSKSILFKLAQWTLALLTVVFLLGLFLWPSNIAMAMGQPAPLAAQHPLSFGRDQTILDLSTLVWEPLQREGVPPGPEIAKLRGDIEDAESLEAVLKLPANYTFPNHSHTSDEVYLWLQGDFTYVAEDGTTTELSNLSYLSLPGGVPHALICGDQPCMLYLRYSRPFDLLLHPMPKHLHPLSR